MSRSFPLSSLLFFLLPHQRWSRRGPRLWWRQKHRLPLRPNELREEPSPPSLLPYHHKKKPKPMRLRIDPLFFSPLPSFPHFGHGDRSGCTGSSEPGPLLVLDRGQRTAAERPFLPFLYPPENVCPRPRLNKVMMWRSIPSTLVFFFFVPLTRRSARMGLPSQFLFSPSFPSFHQLTLQSFARGRRRSVDAQEVSALFLSFFSFFAKPFIGKPRRHTVPFFPTRELWFKPTSRYNGAFPGGHNNVDTL